ncbi:hypothetical protein LX36DRAFT_48144 [Colletotrichum falcatum]|nr:hypothetical protein LX36DRAFT_48144 [Colletotrichum falcatum]
MAVKRSVLYIGRLSVCFIQHQDTLDEPRNRSEAEWLKNGGGFKFPLHLSQSLFVFRSNCHVNPWIAHQLSPPELQSRRPWSTPMCMAGPSTQSSPIPPKANTPAYTLKGIAIQMSSFFASNSVEQYGKSHENLDYSVVGAKNRITRSRRVAAERLLCDIPRPSPYQNQRRTRRPFVTCRFISSLTEGCRG